MANLPPPGAETSLVQVRIDHGVLVAKLLTRSLTHEHQIREVRQLVQEMFPKASKAILIDCTMLTQQVSTQFLQSLSSLSSAAVRRDMPLAVCGVSPAMGKAMGVVDLGSLVKVFPTAKDALFALGEFTEWERARIDGAEQARTKAVKAAKAEAAAVRLPDLGQLLGNRAPAILGGVAAAVVLLAAVVGWASFSGGSGAPRAVGAVGELPGAFPAKAAGTIRAIDKGVELADAGATVLAFAADRFPAKKFRVGASDLTGTGDLAGGEVHRATVDANGAFKLEVRAAPNFTQFHFLIVSAKAKRNGPLAEGDERQLALFFADPQGLLEGRAFALLKSGVSAQKTTVVEHVFK